MYQRGKIVGKIFIVVFCSLKNSKSALKLAKKGAEHLKFSARLNFCGINGLLKFEFYCVYKILIKSIKAVTIIHKIYLNQ